MNQNSDQQRTWSRSRSANRQGNIAVLAAICLVMVIGFLAFSIDVGYVTVTQSELQNAADSGALSGARALEEGREAGISAAKEWANKNVAAGGSVEVVTSEDVEVGFWDADNASFTALEPTDKTSPNAVRLVCRRTSARGNPLTLFFAPVIGTKNADIVVSAIAVSDGGACGGIMALEKIYLNDRQVSRASYSDSYNSSEGEYDPANPGTNGDLCTNGHLTLNGDSMVNGDAHWHQDANDPKADESQVSGEFSSFEKLIEFPEIDPGNSATVNDNDSIPKSANGIDVFNNGVLELGGPPPPLKNGKKKKKGEVEVEAVAADPDYLDLPPGTYYFSSMSVANNSIIRVSGPTYIYVEGQIDLRYGGIENTTKLPINLQIYPMGEDTYCYLPFFGELHAAIYSTKAHIYLDEKNEPINFEFFGKMVGQKIRVWDTALHVDESFEFSNLRSGGSQFGYAGTQLVD